MKKIKQFAAVSLAAIMAISSALPAFAAVRVTESTIDHNMKGQLTIHKFVENNGRNKQGTGLVDPTAINNTLGAAGDTRDNIPLDGIKYSYLRVGNWYSEAGNYKVDTTSGTSAITAEEEAPESATGAYWTSINNDIFGPQAGSILTKLGLTQEYTEFKEKVAANSAEDTEEPYDNENDGYRTRRVWSNANVEKMLNDILSAPAIDAPTAGRTETKAGEVLLNEYITANGAQTGTTDAYGTVMVSNLDLGLYMAVESDITAHDGLMADGNPYVVRPWDSMTDEEKANWANGTTDVYGNTGANKLANKTLTGAQQTEYAALTTNADKKAFYESLYATELTQDSSEYNNPEWPVVETRSKPFLISLPMTNVADIPANQASDNKAHAAGSVWQYDVDAYPKNQTTNIQKRVLDPEDVDDASKGVAQATLRVTEDFMMNEIIHQVIFADVPMLQPSYTYDVNDTGITDMMSTAPTHKTFKIKDTMDPGYYFKGADTVKVVVGPKTDESPDNNSYFRDFTILTRGTDYTVTGNAGAASFEVTLTAAGLKKLDSYDAQSNPDGIKQDSQIAVYFDCDMDKDAKIGTDDHYSKKGNGNRPTLTWQNSNTEERSIEGNYVYVYTYELDITKAGISKPEDVQFTVTHQDGFSNTDPRKGTLVKWAYDTDGNGDIILGHYHVYDQNGLDKDLAETGVFEKISPAHDGTLNLKGFDSKTYRFKEVQAQSGTSLLRDTFDVSFMEEELVRDGELTDAQLAVDGARDSLDIDKTANGGLVSVDVTNQKEISLRTGGEGRWMIIGVASGAAVILLVGLALRKRKAA